MDAVAQGITQTIAIDSCTTWIELALWPVYELRENPPEG
jgi:hypothetical protein